MQFEVIIFEQENGTRPAEEFLRELEESHPDLSAKALGAINKLKDRRNHGGSFTEPLGDGLLAARVGDTNIIRIFFVFNSGQQIWLLNGYIKKTQKIPTNQLARAVKLKKELEGGKK